jgi:hypothetical protein
MRLQEDYLGALQYEASYPVGPHELLVAVPGYIGTPESLAYTLLDTAAEWCVLSAWLARALDLPPEGCTTRLETRFGLFEGWLARLPLRLRANVGEDLTVEATWLVVPEWPGPTVLGWRGCLERFRWAIDPDDEAFYFAPCVRGDSGF